MSRERHLSESELDRAASGAALESEQLIHLHDCEACNIAIDGKASALGPPMMHSATRSPEWLKAAVREAHDELTLAAPPAGRTTSTHTRRRAAFIGGGALAAAAAVVFVVRSWLPPSIEDDPGQVTLRDGELASADLRCRTADGSLSVLVDEQSKCPVGAQLELSVVIPGTRWQRIAFLVCDSAACRLVHSGSLGDRVRPTLNFPNDGPAGERRALLVLTRAELAAASVRGVRSAELADLRHFEQLKLGFPNQQIAFSFTVSDAQ